MAFVQSITVLKYLPGSWMLVFKVSLDHKQLKRHLWADGNCVVKSLILFAFSNGESQDSQAGQGMWAGLTYCVWRENLESSVRQLMRQLTGPQSDSVSAKLWRKGRNRSTIPGNAGHKPPEHFIEHRSIQNRHNCILEAQIYHLKLWH